MYLYALTHKDILDASAIPKIEPTVQCVVDNGKPSLVPSMIQLAVAN